MCPGFLLVTGQSKIWHSHSLGTCNTELPAAIYSELLVSFVDVFVGFVFVGGGFGQFIKVEKTLLES